MAQDGFTAKERRALAGHFSNTNGNVFAITTPPARLTAGP